MNRTDTAKCYALVAASYGLTPSETTVEAWHMLLSDLDGPTALEATRQLCRRDSPWPPRPGEIVALAGRLLGQDAPPVEAAVGFYVAGDWTRHPLIERAARAVYFDRQTMPKEAVFEFRNRYQAALYDEETGTVRSNRLALAGEPERMAIDAAVPDGAPAPMPELLRKANRRALRTLAEGDEDGAA